MKQSVRSVVARVPSGVRALRTLSYWRQRFRFRHFKNTEDLFTSHFRNNEWASVDSVCGPGSAIAYTEKARAGIEELIQRLGVRVILDAPCGDYNWFRLIPRGEQVQYVAGDIVEALVERNRSLYGNSHTVFLKFDITRDSLPYADLWLCRDCLFHFSYEDIFHTIHNFLHSEIRFLLTSTHTECSENTEMPTGSFRLLNLERPPFGFCRPLLYIDDWIEGYPVRRLGLWERKALSHALAANKELQVRDRMLP